MPVEIGKMIYDGRIEARETDGDRPASSESKSQQGKWLNCLGFDPLGGDEFPPLMGIPLDPPYGEKKCSCGKHIMFWLRLPKEIWPDLEMVLVRVFEKT